MITSTEVFAKRKEDIDEAYRMALELMSYPDVDDWGKKAFCWCLIDIIKRDAGNGNNENLSHYRVQLESVEVDPSDEVIAKGIRYALSLSNPSGREINQAKALSTEGRHAEAAAIYRKVFASGSADMETQTGFGWELYRHSKELMAADNVNLGAVKRNLNTYLKLDIEKPSLLHSCILQLAAKLAGQDKFNMAAFARLWNLEYLRLEDFEPFRTKDGKEYPSLAEKVIQQVGKEVAACDNSREQEHALTHLNTAIERFPDNIWLKLYKARVLLALSKHDEALAFGIAVTKAKSNDFWAWSLLGDIIAQTDADAALGCYCKALSCSADDKFTGKIRLTVARHLIEINHLSAAKLEVEAVIRSRENEGYRIPEDVAEIISQPWFAETTTASSNRDFYKSKLPVAEALLFGSLPWIEACIGEKYTAPGRDGREGKPRRKIFIKSSDIPTEVSIPESKLGRMTPQPGDAIRVKGDFDGIQRFQVFVLEDREAVSNWDVFPKLIGVIDHVNHAKGVIHLIVSREIDGMVPLSELGGSVSEGDSLAVRISRYVSKSGPAYRVLEAKVSDEQPDSDIMKQFCEEVRVSNGMGFTESDIFIAPPLVTEHRLEDGQRLSGIAVQNFNRKRGSWGWKVSARRTPS
ncbi:tetratricopeptide repeat protein [Eoetvoesiella caeni]